MIDSLFYALQIVGIVVLVGWAVIHDRLAEGAPTRGPLAYKQDDGPAAGRSPDGGEKPGLPRHRGGATLKSRRR